jgi:hypothetical protein
MTAGGFAEPPRDIFIKEDFRTAFSSSEQDDAQVNPGNSAILSGTELLRGPLSRTRKKRTKKLRTRRSRTRRIGKKRENRSPVLRLPPSCLRLSLEDSPNKEKTGGRGQNRSAAGVKINSNKAPSFSYIHPRPDPKCPQDQIMRAPNAVFQRRRIIKEELRL